MKKHTSSKSSRKASEVRAERVSNPQDKISTGSPSGPASLIELIKLGVDTHAGQYTFARMVDHLGIQPTQSMTPQDFLVFLAKQKKLAQRVVVVYEAGPYGYWLYRRAVELGVECLVCAPERLSRGRKRVNDKIDARELLSRLDRHLAGNTTALRLVRVPTLQQEMSRRQARERNTYRKERQRWIARGRSLLHTMGISRPGRWWELDRYQQLKKMVSEQYGQATADQAWVELDHYLEFIQLASKHLDEATAQLKEAAKQKQAPRLKGIGPLSSELLDREVGDWSRFSNRRQIASYTGLCPGEDSSGDSRISLSIDKHGNPRLRTVLVELAWLLPRYQPNYKRLSRWKWVFEPKAKAPPAMKKKAAVALARQLAVDLWRLRTGRAQPEDLGLSLLSA